MRTLAAIRSEAPFHERLVAFWSNHFTVSVKRPVPRGIAGAFEREAIRPHVTGRFADMLLAVSRHPAMLLYLDNAQSFGPNSPAGRLARQGPEREPGAGDPRAPHPGGRRRLHPGRRAQPGQDPDRLEPGAPGQGRRSRWLQVPPPGPRAGRQDAARAALPGGGRGRGRGGAGRSGAASGDGAARRLQARAGTSLPTIRPAAAVDRLARVFREQRRRPARRRPGPGPARGALAGASAPSSSAAGPRRVDLAGDRIRGGDEERLVPALRLLGQTPWTAPSPAGWPEPREDWAAPDAVLKRIEFATARRPEGRRLGWTRATCPGRSSAPVAQRRPETDDRAGAVARRRPDAAAWPAPSSRGDDHDQPTPDCKAWRAVAAAAALGRAPLGLARLPGERRLVVVILRGGLDGLAAVPPIGDPGLRRARGERSPLPGPGGGRPARPRRPLRPAPGPEGRCRHSTATGELLASIPRRHPTRSARTSTPRTSLRTVPRGPAARATAGSTARSGP